MKLLTSKLARRRYLLVPIAIIAILLLAIEIIARWGAEVLWFEEVGYLPMFLGRSIAQGGLGVGIFTFTAAYLLGNLYLASQLADRERSTLNRQEALVNLNNNRLKPQHHSRGLHLYLLLPLTIGSSLAIGIITLHYLQTAASQWGIDPNLPNISPPAPQLFHPESIWQIFQQLQGYSSLAAALGMLTIALQIYPRVLLSGIATLMSLAIAGVAARQWMRILPWFQATAFGLRDPMFDRDVSAYVFGLPVGELVEFWLMGMCLYGFISVGLTYLLAGESLSQGKFLGFGRAAQRHLLALGGALMLVVSFSYWLSCTKLLYSPRGVSFGASYTDINILLPADKSLSLLALAIGIYLIWRSICFPQQLRYRWLRLILATYLCLEIGTTVILPAIFQTLIVQPNELAKESPYIQRTIAATRQAFGLDNITEHIFNPQTNLTSAQIQANDRIIRNIRLWDKQPLLATNRQLQQIRLYYRFLDADIDRYTLTNEPQLTPPVSPTAPNADRQQVLIAARELDYTAVPTQAQTWVNEHLVYTHGYGFTMSPVNRVTTGGLPEYIVKDIGVREDTPLTTSGAARSSIPIGQPRIYYGESTDTYIMTGTKVKELDYPSGNDNVYNIYDGRGGINIGSTWRKLMFATALNDWRMLLTPEFLPETKLLMRRNIERRIRAIAPFLQYDRDPYLVAADGRANPQSTTDPSYLYWIVDAYTTSDRYPYSDTGKEGINYIRNSVKVVIDAYHGSVSFYIADPRDPIVTTWAKIFPDLFKPLSAMPPSLRRHLRYPVDFFKLQSERLMTYHMTDPQVFYNREDRWQIPTEVYGDKPRLVEPYYAITSLPTVPVPEFNLILPYTPQQRTNLVAWLAARSDGDNYGKLLLYTFPKQRLIYGPEQIEARINQDPEISSQISLWNREGSRAIQGNLLIVPIDRSLLYVEPLYLEATQNQIPTLVRVIVAYENRIVMAESLSKALTTLFQPAAAK